MKNPESKSNRRGFLSSAGKAVGGGALAFGLMGMSMENMPEEATTKPIVDLIGMKPAAKRKLSAAAQRVSPADLKAIVDPYSSSKKMTTRPSRTVQQLTFGDLSDLAGAVNQAGMGQGINNLKVDCSESFCCCCCCCCC